MIGSHHRLGVGPPLLAIKSLRSLEAPTKQNFTTILQVCISILLSVSGGASCNGVSNRRDPITFETGDNRKHSKSILWGKVRGLENSNSEGKDGTTTVELKNHEKSRGGPKPPIIPTGP